MIIGINWWNNQNHEKFLLADTFALKVTDQGTCKIFFLLGVLLRIGNQCSVIYQSMHTLTERIYCRLVIMWIMRYFPLLYLNETNIVTLYMLC